VPHLDTGLLYRVVGRRVLDAGADPADAEAATAAALALVPADLARSDLRGPAADAASSKVASVPGVRAALLDFQRRFAESGAVLDGRDIGTVVLPHARVKLFVTAGLDVRAERRHQELIARGGAVPDLATIRADMAARDEADQNRATAPLRPAAWTPTARWRGRKRSSAGSSASDGRFRGRCKGDAWMIMWLLLDSSQTRRMCPPKPDAVRLHADGSFF
jgi:CMP/dCMP kinase